MKERENRKKKCMRRVEEECGSRRVGGETERGILGIPKIAGKIEEELSESVVGMEKKHGKDKRDVSGVG